jgi:hypothetical protein
MVKKQWFHQFYCSFPVQLFLLHFKKHQLLLIYWGILFSILNGSFMKMFGADALYLAPEYLGSVNGFSASMIGMAVGVFMMSWNITTFILYSRHIKFLATTRKPFVKYCLNNFVVPLIFLAYYLYRVADFGLNKELFSAGRVVELMIGFLTGFILIVFLSFVYFFRADRSITRKISPILQMSGEVSPEEIHTASVTSPGKMVKVKNYLVTPFKSVLVRDVKHYNRDYIETIFNRHHFSAILLIVVAFFYMIGVSFFLDNRYFQFPAAASITLLFAILIAVFGALSYFLQNWSLLITIAALLVLNILYKKKVIDPTNKAYGLDYSKALRPKYDAATISALCDSQKTASDTRAMQQVLERWKQKQDTGKPVIFFINVSGGGTRSATFVMNVLQQLDSVSNGKLMEQTFLINGASGGMLGAAYFRELYRERVHGNPVNLAATGYADDISKDLLNPVFSSLVARDLLSPAQKFTSGGHSYLKDRGYAFEEKLNTNTRNLLNHPLSDYAVDEQQANIPLIFFNSVITRDSRKMIISTQPVSFMMRPFTDSGSLRQPEPDAVDFAALFNRQAPLQLRTLTALRMNATFPYVLPNVWLPSEPVIDLMDAGLRDNYGQESTERFIRVFENWLKKNVSRIVVLTIRDRKLGNWDHPYETGNLAGIFTKPMTQLQYNWVKIQDYMQNDQWSGLEHLFGNQLEKIVFQYIPENEKKGAALSFHLTNSEKAEISRNIYNEHNRKSFERVRTYFRKR